MINQAASKILLVGDLHLFARRSRGMTHWEGLPKMISESGATCCVFIGDIFDFPWARQFEKDAAVTQAALMVEELVRLFPEVTFHYLFGNHDQDPAFETELEKVRRQVPNLMNHNVSLQLGSTLFLHGDAADHREMNVETLLRRRRERAAGARHGRLQESLYRVAVALRMDEAPSWLPFFPNLVHRRLIRFIEREGIEGIQHVVYGHTHRKLEQNTDGVRFTNAGAPIGYRDYNHLTFSELTTITG
ncbi:metallophosphoesterase [Akkermansiaceae bacterium]|nr:metallophosphoesterase [Akkermansiaceae bacterium]MDB4433938.1 metallophosphoesterase [Akkermansiaceae bacterium]